MAAIALLILAAFVTSTISGIIGMGGGILMLAVLFSFLPYGEAIPTHAAVQIFSNGTRILAYLRNVDWRTLGRFAVGAIPGGAIGMLLLWSLGPIEESEPYLKTLIGVYILVSLVLPTPKNIEHKGTWWDFPLLGLVAGMAALTVGAVGPLIAPIFARRAFVKERLVATKATCQMLLHVVKIPAFLWLGGFEFARLTLITVAMIAAVIPGTLVGRRLIRHVSEAAFVTLYRVALTIAGLKVLLVDGLWRLV